MNVIKGTIFDCCATYILEDYEDLDLQIAKESPKSMDMKKELCDHTETTTYDGTLNFTEVITKLKKGKSNIEITHAYTDYII